MSVLSATATTITPFTGLMASRLGEDYIKSIVFGTKTIATLADGHGAYGRLAASFACENVVKMLNDGVERNLHPDEVASLLCRFFVTTNEELREQIGVAKGVTKGGAVLTTVVTGSYSERDYIVFANVGDADACIISQMADATYTTQTCTISHGAENISEQQRLLFGNFPVECMFASKDPDTFYPINDEDGNAIDYSFKEGKNVEDALVAYHTSLKEDQANSTARANEWKALNKIYKASPHYATHSLLVYSTASREKHSTYIVGKEDDERLQITRSIGDFQAEQLGVISTPDLNVVWVDELPMVEKRCVFVASDGVHDCFTKNKLAELVMTVESDEELLGLFVEESKKLFGGSQHDDISFLRKFI